MRVPLRTAHGQRLILMEIFMSRSDRSHRLWTNKEMHTIIVPMGWGRRKLNDLSRRSICMCSCVRHPSMSFSHHHRSASLRMTMHEKSSRSRTSHTEIPIFREYARFREVTIAHQCVWGRWLLSHMPTGQCRRSGFTEKLRWEVVLHHRVSTLANQSVTFLGNVVDVVIEGDWIHAYVTLISRNRFHEEIRTRYCSLVKTSG